MREMWDCGWSRRWQAVQVANGAWDIFDEGGDPIARGLTEQAMKRIISMKDSIPRVYEGLEFLWLDIKARCPEQASRIAALKLDLASTTAVRQRLIEPPI